ncbi:hypothetical protein Aasi_1618 [Candidatus Amoebophilus asiaticus 5a2]|uniref:Uncharacterized protein n=1 Tax=Amoebophilus asiaticus (strain 5a2) TaxID=452471 RepID=C3L4L4_AMOA5|nr:hypothetical protein Aasi_1618 [Candidatus Amoebophilus asiaticus 5a2]
MAGFEPTASRTLNECANRTAPHPEGSDKGNKNMKILYTNFQFYVAP